MPTAVVFTSRPARTRPPATSSHARWGQLGRRLGARLACCLCALFVIGAFVADEPARAQSDDAPRSSPATSVASESRVSLSVHDVPLRSALEHVARQAGVNLVYDTHRVQPHRTSCHASRVPVADALSCLLDGLPLTARRRPTGTYVVLPAPTSQTGRLTGTIIDASTGEPLSNATVLLPGRARPDTASSSGPTGTATGPDGTFSFSSLPPRTYSVTVTYVGYQARAIPVRIRPGTQTHRRIALSPTSISADPVYVDGVRISGADALSEQSFTADRLDGPTGIGTPDLARAAESLMGVSTGRPTVDLRIQGSSNGEHQMRLDGVPVRNPVSLGRLLSAFSPLALGGMTTHKAGFGALHGSHLSGVLEVEHDLSRQDTKLAAFSVDPVSLNGRVQTPLSTRVPATLMVAARVGAWDVYRDPSLEALINEWSTLDPVLTRIWGGGDGNAIPTSALEETSSGAPSVEFYDVHSALRVPLGDAHYLHVSGYHGSSDLGSGLVTAALSPPQEDDVARVSDGSVLPAYDRYSWSNTTAQARYEWMMGTDATATAQAYVSNYTSSSASQAPLPGSAYAQNDLVMSSVLAPPSVTRPGETNDVREFGLNGSLNADVTSATEVDLSLGAQVVESRFRVGNAFIPTLQHAVRTTRWTSAVQATTDLTSRTTLETGLRTTFVPSRLAVYLEPRVALQHTRSATAFGDASFRLAGGLYRQFTNQFDLSRDGASAVVPSVHVWLPVDPSLAPPRALHLAGDVLWSPAPAWSVALEGYAKWQPHLLAVDYPTLRRFGIIGVTDSDRPLTQSSFITESRGRVYGGDARVSYEHDGFEATASYAYSDARRTFPQFHDRLLPTPWNEPHRLTVQTTVPVGAGFSVRLSGDGVWGRAWGYRQAYYDYLTPICLTSKLGSSCRQPGNVVQLPLPSLEDPASDRLPPLYRVNAGLVFDRSWSGVTVRAEVSAINVLNRANVAEWRLHPATDGSYVNAPRTLPGFRPVMSLKLAY